MKRAFFSKIVFMFGVVINTAHSQLNSISNYGATPNDQTCDNTAIQNAVNQGGITYVPAGTFWVCGPINLPTNTNLTGPGTLFLGPGTGTPTLNINGVTNIHITGITLDGNASNQTQIADANYPGNGDVGVINITSASSSDITIQGVFVKNVFNDGISIYDANGVTLQNSKVVDYRRNGIYQQFTNNVNISGNYIDGKLNQTQTGQHGIMIWGQNGSSIGSSNHFVSKNIVKNGTGCGIWATYCRSVLFSDNNVETFGDAGVDLEAVEHSEMSNNVIKNCLTAGVTTFYAAHYILIQGNTIQQDSNYGSGIRFLGTGKSQFISVMNNNIKTINSAGITTEQNILSSSLISGNNIQVNSNLGIRLLEADSMVVTGNKIIVGKVGGSSQNIGITQEGGSRGLISNNSITTLYDGTIGNGDFGGILVYWRSSSFPAKYNTVVQNVITGFKVSINDDCWGDLASYNLIKDNRVGALIRRTGTYNGLFENNKSIDNPNSVISPTTY